MKTKHNNQDEQRFEDFPIEEREKVLASIRKTYLKVVIVVIIMIFVFALYILATTYYKNYDNLKQMWDIEPIKQNDSE